VNLRGRTPELARRDAGVLLEKAREIAVRAEAEIVRQVPSLLPGEKM
jgi:hypothetical protein